MMRAIIITVAFAMAAAVSAAERVVSCSYSQTLSNGANFITGYLVVSQDQSGVVSLESNYFENDIAVHPDGTTSYDVLFTHTADADHIPDYANRFTTIMMAEVIQAGSLTPTIFIVDWFEGTIETVSGSPQVLDNSWSLTTEVKFSVSQYGDCERVQ